MSGICQDIVSSFLRTLESGFKILDNNGSCSIVTPFLDPSGDHIEINAKITNNKLILSDSGETLDYLFINGLELTDTRKRFLSYIINNNNAFIKNDSEICVIVKQPSDIGYSLRQLIRTINSIKHLTYTSRPSGIRTFNEEVSSLFLKHQISFQSLYVIQGKTKEHKVDFFVPSINPLAIKTLSTEQPNYAKRIAAEVAFSFIDSKRNEVNALFVSLVDDRTNVWTGETDEILSFYSDHYIRWSQKEALLELVA